MSAASKIGDALAQYGRAVTLRRRAGTSATFTDVTVHGVAKGYRPQELLGGVTQGDQSVTISNQEILAAGWPGPPVRGDLLVIGGKTTTVQGCETKYLGSDILAHVLWVRG